MLWRCDVEVSGMEIRCVLFDFDCTLVNLTPFVDWGRARRLIVQAYRKQGVPGHLVKRYGGGSLFLMLTRIYDEMLMRLSPDKAREIQVAAFDALEECEAEGTYNAQSMPGCLKTIQWLKSHSVKVGIVSSNSGRVIVEILSLHGLNPFVDAIAARDARYRMKPYPDQFLLCMKKLGYKPRNSVAVGDSRWDMVAAKEAGILSIGLLTGSTGREELSAAGADEVIGGLHELPEALSALDPSLLS